MSKQSPHLPSPKKISCEWVELAECLTDFPGKHSLQSQSRSWCCLAKQKRSFAVRAALRRVCKDAGVLSSAARKLTGLLATVPGWGGLLEAMKRIKSPPMTPMAMYSPNKPVLSFMSQLAFTRSQAFARAQQCS